MTSTFLSSAASARASALSVSDLPSPSCALVTRMERGRPPVDASSKDRAIGANTSDGCGLSPVTGTAPSNGRSTRSASVSADVTASSKTWRAPTSSSPSARPPIAASSIVSPTLGEKGRAGARALSSGWMRPAWKPACDAMSR